MATTKNNGKVRTYDAYLKRLEAVKKSPLTIKAYRLHLMKYAKFINVPVEELHENLNTDDVVNFALSMQHQKANTRKTCLFAVKNFMEYCGLEFDKFETDVFQVESSDERMDKPIQLDTLQKMMDVSDVHGKAVISFLVSTGCRAGEAAKVLLSDVCRFDKKEDKLVPDVNGDVVTIRKEIAKKKKGGVVFLTSEAREFLNLWLKERDEYIEIADLKSKNIAHRINGRPANDQRLFACSYMTINKLFTKAYQMADGQKSGNRNMNTAHSCRAFFRTHAAKTMGIDVAEGILRHSGYLNQAYVRMSTEEKRRIFHDGEHILLITRADQRIQSGELEALKVKNEELEQEMQKLRNILEMHETPAPNFVVTVPKNIPKEQATEINAAIKNLNEVLARLAK